jgi:hypothetical protein
MSVFEISCIMFCLVWFVFFGIKFCIALIKENVKWLGINDNLGEKTLKSPCYEEMFLWNHHTKIIGF